MPANQRDPRVDPRKGDVLRKVNLTRRVECLLPGDRVDVTVGSVVHESPLFAWRKCTMWPKLWQWRKWAATAEVFHVAEGGEENA